MKANPTIAIIGSGVMAEAMIAGILRQKVTTADQICAADIRDERVNELHDLYGIKPFTDNLRAIEGADVVILSVKPQRIESVYTALKGKIPTGAVVLSIVAGASISAVSNGLLHPAVIRAMPNTPAQIGEGITVWVASPAVRQDQIDLARSILTALGQEVFADEEEYLDMATALSGTGPAYVFLFMEAMIDAGVHLGFPRRISEQLVAQTLRGSVDFFLGAKAHPAHLRNQVTSPGGTSAEALYYLEKAGFRTAISRAVWAAYEKSKALGKGKNSEAPEK
ncbi:pyrroline-5-carboxylate reductase [Leptolinea tardivitalis]|uniref:Pyrroline-5-carboxylate reductase n=1 Tax=Leptolinea tardivitalis TaxID=229920 RepID=A0A0P6XTI8_9CHLR|nr:pyrroline-5-carboxylate reductase [Leptolinea tardivitalis]KPL72780.1 pyrroline-5-carboxylate reductase [Leptolinea tardivitalis]GAP20864.1 pyrroline-5-carboxylate reductase [Leptolinea tardivitalis]